MELTMSLAEWVLPIGGEPWLKVAFSESQTTLELGAMHNPLSNRAHAGSAKTVEGRG